MKNTIYLYNKQGLNKKPIKQYWKRWLIWGIKFSVLFGFNLSAFAECPDLGYERGGHGISCVCDQSNTHPSIASYWTVSGKNAGIGDKGDINVGYCSSSTDVVCNDSRPYNLDNNSTLFLKNLISGDFFKCDIVFGDISRSKAYAPQIAFGTITKMVKYEKSCLLHMLDEYGNNFIYPYGISVCQQNYIIGKKLKFFYDKVAILAKYCRGKKDCVDINYVNYMLSAKLITQKFSGVVGSMQMGDRGCYVDVMHDQEKYYTTELADFKICQQKNIIDKRVYLFYEEQNVLAMSCAGDIDCNKSDKVTSIKRIELISSSKIKQVKKLVSATITYPNQNADVQRSIDVKGTLAGYNNNQFFFLVIRSKSFGKLFYPQGEIEKSENWTLKGTYGSPNYDYETFVISTDNAESATLLRKKDSQNRGLKKLPNHTDIISSIIVVTARK